MIEKGAMQCVQEGLIKAENYYYAHKSFNLYKLHSQQPHQSEQVRGIWIVGQSGAGKTHKAQEDYPDAYRKSQNKWWDGYEGQESVILDDLDFNGG